MGCYMLVIAKILYVYVNAKLTCKHWICILVRCFKTKWTVILRKCKSIADGIDMIEKLSADIWRKLKFCKITLILSYTSQNIRYNVLLVLIFAFWLYTSRIRKNTKNIFYLFMEQARKDKLSWGTPFLKVLFICLWFPNVCKPI